MTFWPDPIAFETFKKQKTAAFKRIARATRGAQEPEDIESEAWFMAHRIGQKRGLPVDLMDPTDQDQVLSWLYKRFVDYVRGKHKESLDELPDDDSPPWHDRLSAPAEADPLAQLLLLDESGHALAPNDGFSEFSAYMVLLTRFDLSVTRLAEYLTVSFPTLRRRILIARMWAELQPSLFDEIEAVDMDFFPRSAWLQRLYAQWQSHKVRWHLFTKG